MKTISAIFFAVSAAVTVAMPAAADDLSGVYTRSDDVQKDAEFFPGETVDSYVAIYRKGDTLMAHIRVRSPVSGTSCSMPNGEATVQSESEVSFAETAWGKTCTISYGREDDRLVFKGAKGCTQSCGTANDFGFETGALTKSCDTVNTASMKGIGKYNTVKDVDLLCAE